MLNLAFVIFIIGVVFWINQPTLDKKKLEGLVIAIDKELSKEFTKRDNKIKELEYKIEELQEAVKQNTTK